MTKKQAIRLISFALLTALMIGGLSWLLRDRTTTLSSLYSEPDDTVDVFIVGSSHVNSGYIPGVLWEEYGVSAHNVFSWSQPMWISYHYIKEGLKTQEPSVVVLDLNGMLYGNSSEQPEATDETNYLNSFSITPGWNFLQMIRTVETCGIDLRVAADFLPLPHYHTRWKTLNKEAFTYDPYDDHSYLKGYGFQVRVETMQEPDYAFTDARQAPYETAIEYLDKIVALSRQEDFQLVFVLAPYAYQENEPAIFNWLDDYAAKNNIVFYNYCTQDGDRIGLDWAQDFCDPRHVNYTGALKLTRDLGQLLTEGDYRLRSREEFTNLEALDNDAQKMYRTIALWEEIQNTPAEFLNWVSDTNGTLLLAASGDCSNYPDALWSALDQFGMDQAACLQQTGISYAAVLENGQVQQLTDEGGAAISALALEGQLEACSWGSVSAGVSLTYRDTRIAEGEGGIHLLYYDTVLQRPVYHIAVDHSGVFHYTDVGNLQ